jgi:hypothetical protein
MSITLVIGWQTAVFGLCALAFIVLAMMNGLAEGYSRFLGTVCVLGFILCVIFAFNSPQWVYDAFEYLRNATDNAAAQILGGGS